MNYHQLVNNFRRKIIVDALERNRAIISRAAKYLGLHRNSFSRYMGELGIDIRPIYQRVRGKQWTRKMPKKFIHKSRVRKLPRRERIDAALVNAVERLDTITKRLPSSVLPNSRHVG